MEKIPREKLVEEMFEKTIYEEYKMDKHMEHIVENLAIILSLATIFILWPQPAYPDSAGSH